MQFRTFRNFFSQRIYFKLIFKLRLYKKVTKVNLLTFIRGVGVEKKELRYFLILLSGCVVFSTLGFSYKGYSTNLLHTLQLFQIM